MIINKDLAVFKVQISGWIQGKVGFLSNQISACYIFIFVCYTRYVQGVHKKIALWIFYNYVLFVVIMLSLSDEWWTQIVKEIKQWSVNQLSVEIIQPEIILAPTSVLMFQLCNSISEAHIHHTIMDWQNYLERRYYSLNFKL